MIVFLGPEGVPKVHSNTKICIYFHTHTTHNTHTHTSHTPHTQHTTGAEGFGDILFKNWVAFASTITVLRSLVEFQSLLNHKCGQSLLALLSSRNLC